MKAAKLKWRGLKKLFPKKLRHRIWPGSAEAHKELAQKNRIHFDSPPFILMVGSLKGVSFKEAKMFAEGLAERFISAPKMARVGVQHDKPRNRILYEIHEGGAGYSVLPRVLELLEDKQHIRVELANEAYIEISDEFGELVTLHYPEGTHENLGGFVEDYVPPPSTRLEDLYTLPKLPELFPEKRGLAVAGIGAMLLAAFCLFGSVVYFSLMTSGFFTADPVAAMGKGRYPPSVEDNPYWQLEKAKLAAQSAKKTIDKLEKKDGKWSWRLASPDVVVASSAQGATAAGSLSGVAEGANAGVRNLGKETEEALRPGARPRDLPAAQKGLP